MSGKDLLKELKNLKSASDSLEERIAARVAKKAVVASGEGEPPGNETSQAAKPAPRKHIGTH